MTRKNKKTVFAFLTFAVALFCLFSASAAENEITLAGQINDNYQLVSEGRIFEVEVNEIGINLIVNHNGQKVSVVGRLAEKEGLQLIIVESFQLLEE